MTRKALKYAFGPCGGPIYYSVDRADPIHDAGRRAKRNVRCLRAAMDREIALLVQECAKLTAEDGIDAEEAEKPLLSAVELLKQAESAAASHPDFSIAKPPASRRERLALMATPMDEDTPVIDEDMQSRQMAVYGRESMQKLRKASVLISGLNGLGAEIAKNVILSNPAAVSAAAHRVALQHATAAHCA